MAPPKKAAAPAAPNTPNLSTRKTRATGDTSTTQERQQSPDLAGPSNTRDSSTEHQITLEMIWKKIQHFEERMNDRTPPRTSTSPAPSSKQRRQKQQQRAESTSSSRSDDDAALRSTSQRVKKPRQSTSQAICTKIEETPVPDKRGFRPNFAHPSRGRDYRNIHQGGAPKPRDPDPLDDGIDPTFASWSKLLHGELLQHGHWYPTEAERMAFVFRNTKGKARGHLETLYLSDHPMVFQTAEEMVEHLADCFEELDKQADARDRYALLQQGTSETFRDFPLFRPSYPS